jgi:vancomycin resistance protein YoaR
MVKKIWPKIVFFVPVFLIGFLILTFVGYHLAYWQKIYPGITVLGQSIGNQNLKTAEETINQLISQSHPQSALILKSASTDQIWHLELADFDYQATTTAEKAWQIGRSTNLFRNFQKKIRAWVHSIDFSLEYKLNQEILEQQIEQIASQVFVPTIQPAVEIVEEKVEINPGKEGLELNEKELITIINSRLALLDFSSIDLPLTKISSHLTNEEIEQTRIRAEKFLSKKLIFSTVKATETTWELDDKQLVQLLSFDNGFNQEKIASWSADLAPAINQPPQNAAFEFAQGRVTQFRAAKDGLALEEEKTIELIVNALIDLETSQETINIQLPIVSTPPQITIAEVNSLGIQQLIGHGLSFFYGSISSRIHNIQLAASKLNGLLIPPGEVFFFNQSLGDVSSATGFKQAYIIKEGRTILGDGGGVCQVSTTLFRAALDAGLPIIERRAHAYRVSYYEQSSPVGLDATVFDPTADLKFKNDTPAHLLIQAQTDIQNRKLTFELYGTSDNRIVTISKSRIWDQVPPPPDLYQDDPTLPEGQTKQIDWKAWGAKVAFDYRVERNGETLQSRTFYSNYRPWQAIYLRGIKPL